MILLSSADAEADTFKGQKKKQKVKKKAKPAHLQWLESESRLKLWDFTEEITLRAGSHL